MQSAPTANALHIFPEFLFPPSEIKGTLYYLHTGATSIKAESYLKVKIKNKSEKQKMQALEISEKKKKHPY
jgi:hypothetical protein